MAFAGLIKQLNKANQYVTEKIGGAEGTKLDDEFTEMEKKTDVIIEFVDEIQARIREFLQPNPTVRAKMAAAKGMSRISGQSKGMGIYPQPEGIIGDFFCVFARRIGEDDFFAQSLAEFGDGLKQLAEVKYSLDDNIRQNILEPLHSLQTKDIKEVLHHRKKLQGRRLDYDCKRRRKEKGAHLTDEELRLAEDKFAESLHLAHAGMHNLLENYVEFISQLAVFADALLEYHVNSVDVLKNITQRLHEQKEESAQKPHKELIPLSLMDRITAAHSEEVIGKSLPSPKMQNHSSSELVDDVFNTAKHSLLPGKSSVPCCRALYDFDPETSSELALKEGQTVQLISQVDENWFEGILNGKTGLFPISYVQVLVPLP